MAVVELVKTSGRGVADPTADSETVADIYLLGAGVTFPDQLSIQTIEAMRLCKRIYSNLPDPDLAVVPADFRSKITGLWSVYQDNRDRTLNYLDVAQAVLDAVKLEQPIGWLTPGHPLVFDSVSQVLLSAAEEQDRSVCVVPAISCLDTVLAQLGYDPASGLVILEATSVVAEDRALMPDVATLLLQPSAFGSAVAHYSSSWQPDLAPLRDHLARYFPWDQPCAFVRSSSRQAGPANLSWYPLAEITQAPFDVIAGSTLFIPAA